MTNDDPYRFGPPEPAPRPVVARSSGPTGREILRSTWGLLRTDRSMIWLALVGNLASLAVVVALVVPGVAISASLGHNQNAPLIVAGVLGVLLGAIVAIYFQAALVIGANQRAEGRAPTFNGVLAEAWTLRWRIVQWAIVSCTAGLVIRAVEQRLGFLGRIVGIIGAIAWAVASFFVVPVLVAQRVGPIDAVKYSSRVIKNTWGTSLRTTLRFGVIQFVLTIVPMALTFIGVAFFIAGLNDHAGYTAIGAVLFLVGLVGLFTIGATFGAIGIYARALIYRWSQGQPVPGIDPSLFDGAFVAKRRRRR